MSILDFFTREAGQERRRALEGLLTQFIPPEMRPQLGLLAEAQPIRGAERAGQGAVRVMNTQGMDRVQAIGDTLSEMAGVVAPAMVAGRAGVPLANAVTETLTGYAPAVQPFLVDEFGGVGFRAFHGSPHDFDRFSMSKIGTGEGAQAYGHGLYFADSEGTARFYRDELSGNTSAVTKSGVPLRESKKFGEWGSWVNSKFRSGATPEEIADGLRGMVARDGQSRFVADQSRYRRAMALADEIAAGNVRWKSDGRMYEVQINADPNDFLDWDKPLSAQSPNVQRQFGYIAKPTPEEEVAAYELAKRESPNDIGNHPAIQDIYRRESAANAAERYFQRQVTGGGIDEAARISLSEAGIPGIRYLDAGSRGAGDGSRNYVVFDENLIEIVRKYGIAGAAALLGLSQADVAQAMDQQQQPQGLLVGPQ